MVAVVVAAAAAVVVVGIVALLAPAIATVVLAYTYYHADRHGVG